MNTENQTSYRIVAAVSRREGVAPHELEEVLYDAVDPDALDQLFNNTNGSVTFDYHGYRITVDSDGNIDLVPR